MKERFIITPARTPKIKNTKSSLSEYVDTTKEEIPDFLRWCEKNLESLEKTERIIARSKHLKNVERLDVRQSILYLKKFPKTRKTPSAYIEYSHLMMVIGKQIERIYDVWKIRDRCRNAWYDLLCELGIIVPPRKESELWKILGITTTKADQYRFYSRLLRKFPLFQRVKNIGTQAFIRRASELQIFFFDKSNISFIEKWQDITY